MKISTTKTFGFSILLLGLLLCGTGLWLLLSPAQYRATAIIRVDREEAGGDMNVIGERPLTPGYDPYFVPTTFEVVKSQFVLSNVVSALNLNVEWGKRFGDGSPLKTIETIKRLRRRMNLESVPNIKLVKIGFSGNSPNEAARIANAVAEVFKNYREEMQTKLILGGIRVLTNQYQIEEQQIKGQRDTVEELKKKITEPVPEVPSPTMTYNPLRDRTNHQPLGTKVLMYFNGAQKLADMEEFHKLLAAKIEFEKINFEKPKVSCVEIVAAAKPPDFPTGPNRWLGAAFLAIGLLPTVGGFLLLKSSRRQSL